MARPKAFKEADILEKAMLVFWKTGYHATTYQDLVTAMGISRQSMYDTFGNKESLFQKAFLHYRQKNKLRIRELLSSYPSVKEGLSSMLVESITNTLADEDRKGCFAVNCSTEVAAGDVKILPLLAENRKEFIQFFKEYLDGGKENGQLSNEADTETLASYIFTLYSGLQVNAKISNDLAELTSIIKAGLSLLDKE
ncbi:MAG: TetR/AcrR family transcriptional regulator [Bacteroidota bacterium]